jgi:ribosome biogenesis GTPase A
VLPFAPACLPTVSCDREVRLLNTTTVLDDQYQDFLRQEKSLLWDLHNVLLKTGPREAEITHLQDILEQLDELFLLVIVGEFNSGKSAFINALLGKKC